MVKGHPDLSLILLVEKLLESVNQTRQKYNNYWYLSTLFQDEHFGKISHFSAGGICGCREEKKNTEDTIHMSLKSLTFEYTSRYNITATSGIPKILLLSLFICAS